MFKNKLSIFLFLLEVIALSLYIWQQIILTVLINSHKPLYLFILSFVLLTISLGAIIYWILIFYARFLTSKTYENHLVLGKSIIITLSPFLLLYLSLLQYVVFLKDIRFALPVISCLGFFYLHFLFLFQLKRQYPSKIFLSKTWGVFRIDGLNQRQTSIFVFVASIFIYWFFTSGFLFSPFPITGDEPHYLIITKSMLSDGDINLWNNYQNKDYLEFYPGELDSHARPGRKSLKHQYSRHMPGLPVLLLPSYFIGTNIGKFISSFTKNHIHEKETLIFMVRLFMCIFTALLSWIFFLLVQDLLKNRKSSLLSWLIFSFSTPLLFYSHMIYPEVPAALIVILIFWRIIKKQESTSLNSGMIGVGIALLPWLGVKYSVLALGILCLFFFSYIKSKKVKLTNILCFISPLILSFLLFLFYLQSIYGTLSPLSIYEGTAENNGFMLLKFFHFNLVEFFRCGLGYLFDQRAGILAYTPVYIFFIPGVFLMLKKKKKETFFLLFIFSLYWAFCSLGYYWGGYCPPGRTLLPVLWIMALLMAYAFAKNRNRKSIIITKILILLSFLMTLIFANNPKLLYHENLSFSWSQNGIFSNFLTSISNFFIDFKKVVPTLASKENFSWIPLILWIFVATIITFTFLNKKKTRGQIKSVIKINTHLTYVLILSMSIITYMFFNIHLDDKHFYKNRTYQLYFQDKNNYGKELDGFWTKGKSTTEVLVKSLGRASEISLSLSSRVGGKTIIQVGRFKRTINLNKGNRLKKTVTFPSPVGFPWKGEYLYYIKIKEDKGFIPNKLDSRIKDNRFLGVFIQTEVN